MKQKEITDFAEPRYQRVTMSPRWLQLYMCRKITRSYYFILFVRTRRMKDVTRCIIIRLIEQCVHYARDITMYRGCVREEREKTTAKTRYIIDVTTCITLSYRHGNYVTDKHTTCYQREEEAKDAKKYFRNLVIFHKTLRLDFSN